MTAQTFDHERLDVYRLAIDYVAQSFEASQPLGGLHRHARDQWRGASQSIPLNIAVGNGKRSRKDRARFNCVAESNAKYHAHVDYDYEHRFAEHEHDTEPENTLEPQLWHGRPPPHGFAYDLSFVTPLAPSNLGKSYECGARS